MNDGLSPYSEYKDSGLLWLEKIPAHWELRRMKFLMREIDLRSQSGKEQLLRVSQYTGVTPRHSVDGSDNPDTRASSLVGYRRVQQNDLVINIMLAWNGSLGVSRYDGIVSPAYCVYRFNAGLQPQFFDYLLHAPVYKGRIKVASTGVVESRLRLYSDDFGRIETLLPPLDEQSAIVRYLDHANQRIDRYIRVKRKLIALLNEQKQAIIYRAVTRGLDPNIRLKPSGVAWLGDVPEHWTIIPFVRCAEERADYRGATPTKTESGIFLVTAKNIRKGWIDYEASKEFVSKNEYATIMRRGLPKIGDLLFTTEAPLGNIALVDREDIALAQRVIRFRLDEKVVLPRFALNSMLSDYFQNQLLCRATGSTASGIKASKLPQLQIVLPTLKEQKEILDWIAESIAPMNWGIQNGQREIELIREYRTRLIADVVTGKVDVRTAAQQLPVTEIAETETPSEIENGELAEESEE